MKTRFIVPLVLFAGVSVQAQDPLPASWKHQDIGAAEVSGSATHAAGVFTVQGTMDIWGTADGCHVAWQPLRGDGELVARVTAIENAVGHAKAGLCLRASVEPGAVHATMAVTPADGTQFLSREQKDGKTTVQKTGADKGRFPCWLKIVRHGREFSGYESGDGEKWTLIGKINLELGADTIVGLTSSSHVKTTLCKSTFDHVKLTTHADAP